MTFDELQKRNKKLEFRWKIFAIIAILFLITRPVALFVVKNIIHKAVNDATANPYPLLDPARQYIDQKDYIINLQPLRQYLNDLVSKEGKETIQIYYEQLNTGANISINQDLRLPPASLSKLPLAISVVHKIESGKWHWDDELILSKVDADNRSGELGLQPVGTTFTIEELVRQLLVNSDNTAYNILGRNLDNEDLKPLIDETGLQDLYDANDMVTAKEFSRIFRTLYTSDFLERADSQKVLDWLSQSTFHEYLSQGVPQDVKFAHKYGENKDLQVLADSGIVYQGNRPYMITVLIKLPDQSDAARQHGLDLMKDISKHVFDYGQSAL
jgi:beta-lactamase class A